jgi:Gpi18-like mannosyltransferase
VIFLAGVYLLTKELKLNTFVVYAMIFTPFMLSYAMFTGTELLFLALILFAIYFIVKNSFWAGFFLGLSALTRYTGIVFVAFIF